MTIRDYSTIPVSTGTKFASFLVVGAFVVLDQAVGVAVRSTRAFKQEWAARIAELDAHA